MTNGQKISQAVCPYCVLGLKAGASGNQVEEAFNRLIKTFDEEKFMDTPQSWVQAQQACMCIENAYKRIAEGDTEEVLEECQESEAEADGLVHPKLGQMLVAAGLISLEQLEEAISKQKSVDLKIGEILKGMNLVTQMELDSFLLNQSLIKLPLGSPYHFGKRLIGLGLVTEDMVRIALVEQRTSQLSLGRILVNRHWLAEDVLQALMESGAEDGSPEEAVCLTDEGAIGVST
jgi:hypothetical protein